MTSGSRELIGFFSFSFEDSDLARKLMRCVQHELSLQTDENIRFWQPDEVSLVDRDAIGQAIAISDFFIPLISPSFAESAHCQSEFARFFDNDPGGSRIFPIVCANLDGRTADFLPDRLQHHQLYDLSSAAHSSTDVAAIIQRLSEDIIKAVKHTHKPEEQILQQTPVSSGVPTDAAALSYAESATSFSPPSETVLAAQSISGSRQAANSAALAELLNAQESRRRWAQAWQKVVREERRLTDRIEQLQVRARDFERSVIEEIGRLTEETHLLEAERHCAAVEKKRLELERPTVGLDSLGLPSVSERRGAA